MPGRDSDIAAIRRLLQRQFASLSWTGARDADWSGFAATFIEGALLFPAARPLKPQTVAQFIERMKRLRAEGKLRTFEETPLGCEVRVFGNVAMAFAGCEMLENGATVTRDVSASILVKEDGRWRIAAQGWDVETPQRPLPADIARR